MSYKKVMELSKKFAKKTYLFNNDNDIIQQHQLLPIFIEFQKQFRALLQEMHGDYRVLKIKGMNQHILQEFAELYHKLIELYKQIDEDQLHENINKLINFVLSVPTTTLINILNINIQKFLKDHEVDFISGKVIQQVKIQSLQKLLEIINNINHKMKNIQDNESFYRLLTEKEEYNPSAVKEDKTIVGKK